MINIYRVLILGGALLVCACSSTIPSRRSIPEVGLTLTYSNHWVEVGKERLTEAYGSYSGPDKQRMPGGDFSSVIFAIANRAYGERTPIITISVIPNSKAACSIAAETGFVREVAAAEAQRFPGAVFDFGKFSDLKLAHQFQGYLMRLSLQDRTVSQYHIFYCQNDDFVRIEGSSSTAAADSEVERVLSTLVRE